MYVFALLSKNIMIRYAIHISLLKHCAIQVKSIKFTEWNKGANPDMNPVTVHIHINRNSLGFEVRLLFEKCKTDL